MLGKDGVVIGRRDIEEKLASVGDYVKMDYLQSCLKKNLDFDTKKFVLLKLSGIYESRKMHLEAGKLLRAAAEINATFEGKMQDFMKSMELYIKGDNFDDAEISYAKALACADGMQKERLKTRRKEVYKAYGQECMNRDKRKRAMETYEKYLSIPELTLQERSEAQANLLALYEKLGKITEYGSLKRAMSQPSQQTPKLPERKPQNFSFRDIGLD
jgi:tetratricopeptide (TPR) repeat protein